MKTLAELKRNAAAGNMSLELIERFGLFDNEISENYQGKRRVLKPTSFGLVLLNPDGCESRLDIRSAKLAEYDGKTLVIYGIGTRKPTPEEQALLDEWKIIEKEFYEQNPWGNTFWKQKNFFASSPYPYMYGYDTHPSSKRYDPSIGLIWDTQVRGDVILRYNVYFD